MDTDTYNREEPDLRETELSDEKCHKTSKKTINILSHTV